MVLHTRPPTPLLDGQLVTPDSLLLFRNEVAVVQRASEQRCFGGRNRINNPLHSHTHLEFIALYPLAAKNWYSWPDLRQITQYFANHGNTPSP